MSDAVNKVSVIALGSIGEVNSVKSTSVMETLSCAILGDDPILSALDNFPNSSAIWVKFKGPKSILSTFGEIENEDSEEEDDDDDNNTEEDDIDALDNQFIL